jgi:hypothetical protein
MVRISRSGRPNLRKQSKSSSRARRIKISGIGPGTKSRVRLAAVSRIRSEPRGRTITTGIIRARLIGGYSTIIRSNIRDYPPS